MEKKTLRSLAPDLTWREWLGVIAPFLLLGIVVAVLAWLYVEPAPPSRVVIAGGPEGSAYNDFAAGYARHFAAQGIALEVRQTGGAAENFDLLLDPASGVDLALVQGGTAPAAAKTGEVIEAVCAVSFEPLFIVHAVRPGQTELTELSPFRGKRIAVGSLKGGTRTLAMALLAIHGIGTQEDRETTIVDVGGKDSAAKLQAGELDVSFFAVPPGTPYVIDLLAQPGFRLVDLRRAEAYSRRLDSLAAVTLHEGVLDLARNIPDREVRMVAPFTGLVSRKSTHKAVLQLAVQAAQLVHGGRDLLAAPGMLPTLEYGEIPTGEEARYFFSARPGFLQRNLPFWLASLVDRAMFLIVPLLFILIPLFRLVPGLYQSQMKGRIYRWYKRLRALEGRAQEQLSPGESSEELEAARKLEDEIHRSTRVPLGYMDLLYQLRVHAAFVRGRFEARGDGGRVVRPQAQAPDGST